MTDYGDVNNCFFPKDLYYSVENNTWTKLNDDGTVTIGMTDIAQTLAGSVLHATPQRVGKKRKIGKPVAIVESSKWVGPVKSPIAGEVVESNDELKTDPGLLNKSPYNRGWIVKMQPDDLEADLAALVTGDAAVDLYRKKIEDEGIDACVHCEGYEI